MRVDCAIAVAADSVTRAETTRFSDCVVDQVFDTVFGMKSSTAHTATEISRRLALSHTETEAVTALHAALASHLPTTLTALRNGTIDIITAAGLAYLAGFVSATQAHLATEILTPGRHEWRWVT